MNVRMGITLKVFNDDLMLSPCKNGTHTFSALYEIYEIYIKHKEIMLAAIFSVETAQQWEVKTLINCRM